MPEGKATTEGGLSRGAKEALRAWIETNVRHCPAANHLPNRLLNQLPPVWRLAPTEYLFTSLRLPTVYGYDPHQLNPPARHIFYGLFKNRHDCSMKVCLCPIALLLVDRLRSALPPGNNKDTGRYPPEVQTYKQVEKRLDAMRSKEQAKAKASIALRRDAPSEL